MALPGNMITYAEIERRTNKQNVATALKKKKKYFMVYTMISLVNKQYVLPMLLVRTFK